MKTRSNESSVRTGLPPPPAPPARDANPWSTSSPAGGPPPPPRMRATHRRSRSVPGGKRSIGAAPLLVLVFIGAAGLRLAIQAWREQDYPGMIAALAILSMVAFMVWRRSRRRS